MPATERMRPLNTWKWKVLVIDDAEASRLSLRQILEEAGMQVVLASNGPGALGILQDDEGISLVLCDLNLPEMDGLSMLAEAQQRNLLHDIPVFMLTAEAAGRRLDRARRARVTAWIIKPAHPLSLVATIERVMALDARRLGA